MAHRFTAVVEFPQALMDACPPREIVTGEVNMWYEAMDMVQMELVQRHPQLKQLGFDDLVIRSMSMIHVED